MADRATIMVVDDVPENVRLLEAVLVPRGYDVTTAGSGEEAIEKVGADPPNLILLDLMMPGMDGHEVCRRLRSEPASQFLPIVMVTASGAQEKVRALETGADDFITKPFDQAELLARVRSLLRIHEYRATIESQAAELERWNHTLETRVAEQVAEIERVGRLKRFLSPQVSEVILSNPKLLESHRCEITVVFADLRGFTSFAESAEPRGRPRRPARISRGARRVDLRARRDARALHGRRGDGLLQRSPALSGRAARRGEHGGGDAVPGRGVEGRVGATRPQPRLRHGGRAGIRHGRRNRVRGPLRTTRRSGP